MERMFYLFWIFFCACAFSSQVLAGDQLRVTLTTNDHRETFLIEPGKEFVRDDRHEVIYVRHIGCEDRNLGTPAPRPMVGRRFSISASRVLDGQVLIQVNYAYDEFKGLSPIKHTENCIINNPETAGVATEGLGLKVRRDSVQTEWVTDQSPTHRVKVTVELI